MENELLPNDRSKLSFAELDRDEIINIKSFFNAMLTNNEMVKIKMGFFDRRTKYLGEVNRNNLYHGIGQHIYGTFSNYLYIGEFKNGLYDGDGYIYPRNYWKYNILTKYFMTTFKAGNIVKVVFNDETRDYNIHVVCENNNIIITKITNNKKIIIEGQYNTKKFLKEHTYFSFCIGMDSFVSSENFIFEKSRIEEFDAITLTEKTKDKNIMNVEYSVASKIFFKGQIFVDSIDRLLNYDYEYGYGLVLSDKYNMEYPIKTLNIGNKMKFLFRTFPLEGKCEINLPEIGKYYEGYFTYGYKNGDGVEYFSKNGEQISKNVSFRFGYRMTGL